MAVTLGTRRFLKGKNRLFERFKNILVMFSLIGYAAHVKYGGNPVLKENPSGSFHSRYAGFNVIIPVDPDMGLVRPPTSFDIIFAPMPPIPEGAEYAGMSFRLTVPDVTTTRLNLSLIHI